MNFNSDEYRYVMGHYPTGVVAITAMVQGEPRGMVVGTFSSVSLDPKIVSFMPSRQSNSWKHLQHADRYCINIIGSNQETMCRNLAARVPNKFDHVSWHISESGHLRLDGATAYLECDVTEVFVMGDHDVVMCRPTSLEMGSKELPLLFYRGGYGSFVPLSEIAWQISPDGLRSINVVRPLMDKLALELDTEVTAVLQQGDSLILAAAAGQSQTSDVPMRVGIELPFIPPLGGVFAAWGTEQLRSAWIDGDANPDRALAACELIRERGYAIGFGHERSAEWEKHGFDRRSKEAGSTSLHSLIQKVAPDYNVDFPSEDEQMEFRFAQAPVFGPNGQVALALTLWGPSGRISLPAVHEWTNRLLETSSEASQLLGNLEHVGA